MRECPIGSLPWFAGVWWLGLAWAAHGLAWGAVGLGARGLAWRALDWSDRATELAVRCAIEGGAER